MSDTARIEAAQALYKKLGYTGRVMMKENSVGGYDYAAVNANGAILSNQPRIRTSTIENPVAGTRDSFITVTGTTPSGDVYSKRWGVDQTTPSVNADGSIKGAKAKTDGLDPDILKSDPYKPGNDPQVVDPEKIGKIKNLEITKLLGNVKAGTPEFKGLVEASFDSGENGPTKAAELQQKQKPAPGVQAPRMVV